MWTGLSYVFLGSCVSIACRAQAPRAEQNPSHVMAASNQTTSQPPTGASSGGFAAPVLLDSGATFASPAPPASALEPASPLEPAANHDATTPRRVVVLGDSLSDPRVHGGGYLNALARCPGVTIQNVAKGGFMVNQMRRRFENDVVATLDETSTDLIVFGGVNDLYSDETAGRTVAKITADLTRIYRLARVHHLRIIALTVTPWGGFTRYYNERRAQATQRLNRWIWEQLDTHLVDVVIDASTLLSCGNPERLCPEYEPPFHDGIHFGREGHQKLGERLETAFSACAH